MLAVILLFCFILLYQSSLFSQTAFRSLCFCGRVLVPALFPFAVIGRLICVCDIFKAFGFLTKPLRKLLRVSSAGLSAVLLGFFCGFPMGAYSAMSLYDENMISKSEAERIACFANNAGLAFLVGSIGAMLKNARFGWILFAAQSVASLIVGIFMGVFSGVSEKSTGRTEKPEEKTATVISRKITLPLVCDCIKSAAYAMISVTAFSVFFSVFCAVLEQICLRFFNNEFSEFINIIINCVFEVGGASALLCEMSNNLSLPLLGFAVGWSGFSVIMQTVALCGERISIIKVICVRFVIGILTCVAVTLLL